MVPRSSTFLPVFLLLAGAALAQMPPSDAARKELAAKNLREGEEILAANGKRPGVFTTYKGLPQAAGPPIHPVGKCGRSAMG